MLLSKNRLTGGRLLLLVISLTILSFSQAFAQREIYPEDNPPLSERMYFGGNLSLQFGTITFIDVSPLAGVMITEKYSAGVGATYQYFNDRFFNYNSNIYGGRIFNRYNVLPRIFAHAEYETLNLEVANQLPNSNDIVLTRDWVPGFLVGAGYFSPFGNRGGMNFMLLYNLTHDNLRSPYREPYVIRVGFVF